MAATNGVKANKVDVLIVGAGPAGLMAANALSLAGVNVKIVDIKYATPCPRRLRLTLTAGQRKSPLVKLMVYSPGRSRSSRLALIYLDFERCIYSVHVELWLGRATAERGTPDAYSCELSVNDKRLLS